MSDADESTAAASAKPISAILEQLTSTEPRETSGSRNYERPDFQIAWGLLHLLELHVADVPYAVAFEFHDDILVLDNATHPTKVRFYQVKTRNSGRWTLNGLTKQEQGKKGPKASIVGKLFFNRQLFPSTEHLGFVSNQPCKFLSDDTEVCCFGDAKKNDFKTFLDSLRAECGEVPEADAKLFHYHHTPLKLADYETTLKGHVVEFIARQCGEIEYNFLGFFRMITDECRRKSKKDATTCKPEHIVRDKFVTREDVEHWLRELSLRALRKPNWHEVSADLSGVAAARKLIIREKWALYEARRFDSADTAHSMLRDLVRSAVIAIDMTTEAPLIEIVENVVDEIGGRARSIDPSNDDHYLCAAILFEIYAYDPTREVQAPNSQPPAQTK